MSNRNIAGQGCKGKWKEVMLFSNWKVAGQGCKGRSAGTNGVHHCCMTCWVNARKSLTRLIQATERLQDKVAKAELQPSNQPCTAVLAYTDKEDLQGKIAGQLASAAAVPG